MKYFAALACFSLLAATDPKPSPDDYPVRHEFGHYTLAAEYLGHTAPGAKQAFFVRDYIVVDIAIYPLKGRIVRVSAEDFRLQINGKIPALYPQSAGMVAGSLKWDDWTRRPTAQASIGDPQSGSVTIGGPRPVPRFPGDRRQMPLPPAPRVPPPEDRSGVEKASEQTADEAVVAEALYEGIIDASMHGLLYFPYRGKLKSIKRLDLMVGEVKIALPLR